VKISKTYKQKLKLTRSQEATIDSWLHTCRAIYNLALDTKIYAYKSAHQSLSNFDLQKQLTELKAEEEFKWIKEVPSQSLQSVIERMDFAYQSFFRGGGFPKFKRRDNYNSITFKSIKANGLDRIVLPKLGSVKFFWSREILGDLKRATITKEINGYYISILTSQEINIKPIEFYNENQVIGIDVGVNYFVVSSDGEFVDNPRFMQNNRRKMRILQRGLARQVKKSNKWYKTKDKIAKLHLKTKSQRKDFLHKTANSFIKHYDFISAEKLQVKNMTKSTKGTMENPGKNVKQKSGLNRSLLDVGFGMFFDLLKYKSVWNGKIFIQISPQYTSQKCSVCGHIDKENRKTQSKFLCVKCGHQQNADYNAAENIKREGISRFRQREAVACA